MPSKVKKKKPSAGAAKRKKRDRVNSLDMTKLREYLDEVHEITDKMEGSNARARQSIGKAYERASAALNLTKKAVAKAFRKERAQFKEEAQMQETGTSEDRDSLLQIAAAYGDDSPIGQWAAKLADQINDGDGGDEEEEAERQPAAEKVGKVVALHGPS